MKKKTKIWLISIIAIIVILILITITSYNSLVQSQTTATKAWANVEVTYQRRADLIPNLVQTVQGYATHEKSTLTEIANLRSQYQSAKTPAELQATDIKFNIALRAVAEAYPDLKANQNFLALQDELAGTENRIAVARRDYNEAANSYNLSIRTFPKLIFANIFGFTKRDLFQATETAKTAPSVSFN